MTNTAATSLYICKACGAQSPTGIGYAANAQTSFPAPAATCPNDHIGA